MKSIDAGTNCASVGEFSSLENIFHTALLDLDVSIESRDLLSLAAVVDGCMAGDRRRYHGLDHIFDLCIGKDPVVSLALLFHDTVYFEVDGGDLPDLRICQKIGGDQHIGTGPRPRLKLPKLTGVCARREQRAAADTKFGSSGFCVGPTEAGTDMDCVLD